MSSTEMQRGVKHQQPLLVTSIVNIHLQELDSPLSRQHLRR